METSGFDCHTSRIVGISFSASEGEACYVPISEGDREGFLATLRPLLEEPSIAKIGQNIKFDIMALAAAGIRVAGFKYDTMILHYLLDPESRHGMNHLARFYLNYSPIEIESLIGRGSRQLTMDRVPLEAIAEYGAEDADVTLRLKNLLWPQIAGTGFEKLYREIEEPLIDVLADIELTGVKIDTARLAEYGRDYRYEDFRRQVTLLSQKTFVYSASIRDNLTMFSGTAQQDEALTKTLADAGLSKWYAERGASMDTQIGGEEHALSGGEERRLDLARTLWRKGSLVMLDEPAAGLDEKTRVELEKQIAQLPCEILIVAMHNYSPEFLDSFTKVLRIRDGEIVM